VARRPTRRSSARPPCCSNGWCATTRSRTGTRRTAFLLTLIFLERNGRDWAAPDVGEDGETVRRIAAGELGLEQIVSWIKRRSVPR
jgi:hypothetical protein